MERWIGRVALVTGASDGIGAATAKHLVKNGMKVIGCARRLEKLEALAGDDQVKESSGQFVPMRCDVSKEAEVLEMFSKIQQDFGGVDVCINNAGRSSSEGLLDGSTGVWEDMLGVNILGLCMCTRESIKSMRSRGVDDGHVINLSSMAGYRQPPGRSAFYSATKHAVRALTEGTRRELRGLNSGIRVSQISPGFVETEFHNVANPTNPQQVQKMFKNFKHCLQPEDIADTIVYMLSTPAHIEVHDILVRPTEQKV